jgi:hypothetical protein
MRAKQAGKKARYTLTAIGNGWDPDGGEQL